jgi:uncharacterized protein
MTVLTTHRIDPAAFDALAGGYGDAAAVEVLVRGQQSRRKATLMALADPLSQQPARRRFLDAVALLADVERQAPDAVTGRTGVLRHPYLDVWGMSLLRALAAADGALPELDVRLSYLTGAAAVAAATAGRSAELEVVVPGGGLPLPGLGITAGTGAAVPASVQVSDGRITVRTADGEPRQLRLIPNRVLRGAPHEVRLDDTDPYRDTFGSRVADHADDATADRWVETFRQAWAMIGEHHAAYLPGLMAGLTTITPLLPVEGGMDASAAARRAFGAISSVLPPTPARLAVLLIHEFQHVKLGGLLDLVEIFDESDTALYYAPWRPDPRPLPNLVQGTYAHLGVTDFWRVHRHHTGADASHAAQQFARWRLLTAEAIEVLAASPALTDAGRRFAEAMAATVMPWLDEPVPEADERAARDAAERHRRTWLENRGRTSGDS